MDSGQLEYKMTNKLKLVIVAIVTILLVMIIVLTNKPYPTELSPEELAQLDTIQRDAYAQAIKCSNTKTPKLKYEDIDWVIVPEYRLVVKAVDGSVTLGGYFSPIDSVIYLPYPNRNKRWILIHESLHAIGYLGHPDVPFRYPCGVMAEQN